MNFYKFPYNYKSLVRYLAYLLDNIQTSSPGIVTRGFPMIIATWCGQCSKIFCRYPACALQLYLNSISLLLMDS